MAFWICYLSKCFIAALGIRVVINVFKTFALRDGESFNLKKYEDQDSYYALLKLSWCDTFWRSFIGFSKKHWYYRDYLLGALIGLAELITYPFLLSKGKWQIVGGWIAIKTAAQWSVWIRSRTTFNRFLLANIIILAVSYAWLKRYVVCSIP
ncbi:MAG: hypothetical protein FVQ80_16200 [Planctomycetes bacterium]|nr:hypothetical protein [Planctomycetota bacterium]